MWISTRRFCARPWSVSLLAIGRSWPCPFEVMRPASTPWLARYSRTVAARRNEPHGGLIGDPVPDVGADRDRFESRALREVGSNEAVENQLVRRQGELVILNRALLCAREERTREDRASCQRWNQLCSTHENDLHIVIDLNGD
jgi:hypothetical protein